MAYTYIIKPRAPAVSYTMYAAALGSAGSGGLGCTPSGGDPDAGYAGWCTNELDLVTRAQQQLMATEFAGCTLNGTTLTTDNASNASPSIERDPSNPQRGIIRSHTGYDTDYRRYQTSAQCTDENGTTTRTRLWSLRRHVTLLCPNGFIASIGAAVTGAYCEAALDKAAIIVGPLQQVKSCPASPNPCYPATGEKARQEPDFDFAGRTFTRYYHSLGQLRNNPAFALGWTHTYSDRVYGFAGAPSVGVVSDAGYFESFVSIGTGRYRGENSVDRVLESINEGAAVWRLRDGDGELREFDSNGRLIAIRHPADPVNAVTLTYANELPIQAIDGTGRILGFEYADGRLTRMVKPDGTSVSYGYDADKNLISADYGNGQIKQYHYHEAGRADPKFVNHLTGITSETGQRFANFTYDSNGRVTESRVLGTPNEVTTVSYPTSTSATLTTANGLARQYTIQAGLYRKVTSVSDEAGQVQSTYDPEGRLLTRTDKRGVVTRFEYTDAYRSATIEAFGTPQQRRIETTHDPITNLITERRVYNDTGGLVAKHTTTYNARQQANSATVTDPTTNATRTTTLAYCEQSDVTAGTCPIVGQLRRVDGPRSGSSDVVDYTYRMTDAVGCDTAPATCAYRKGDLWTVTNALGHVVEALRYDGAGRPLSMKDANGVVTDLVYSPRGWVTTQIVRGDNDASELDDRFTHITYTENSLPQTMQLPAGETMTYAYDAAHRLIGIADTLGNTVTYTLNGAGDRVKEDTHDATNTLRKTMSLAYDVLGRLQSQADALGRTTTFAYDAANNLDTVTDALGRVSDQTTDALGRVTLSLQDAFGAGALGVQTAYQYDALDRLIQVTDPKGLSTTYAYNGFGERVQLISPDTGTSNFTYDSAGNRVTATDARGVTATYTHDVLNRLTGVAYVDSSRNVTYRYDTPMAPVCRAGEHFSRGRLTAMTDASGSTQYCYDRYGQLITKIQMVGGQSFVARYLHTDPRGRLPGSTTATTNPPPGNQHIGMVYPDGAGTRIVRDAMNRPVELRVTYASGQTQRTLLRDASYAPFGPVTRWTYGNGRVMNRTLNQNYQPGIVQDTAAGGLSVGYEFDEVGNLKTLRNGNQSDPPKRRYTYDRLNRLTETKDGTTNTVLDAYGYDATGNRIADTKNGVVTGYGYAATTHRVNTVGGVSREYDAIGNTVLIGGAAPKNGDNGDENPPPGDPGPGDPPPPGGGETEAFGTNASTALRTFVYDATNRMAEVHHDGVLAASYRYNGKGERVRKTGPDEDTVTLYDEAGHWLGDYMSNGVPLQQAIWLDDLPVGLLIGAGANQKLYYIQADALGMPRVLIDPDRDVAVWTWELTNEAFGDSAPNQDPDNDGIAFVFDMRFPGQRFDAATGFNYNYFRDYEPGTGRYSQSDPIGLASGVSTYGYVVGNPLRYTDPFGLEVIGIHTDAVPGGPDNMHAWLAIYGDDGKLQMTLGGWKPSHRYAASEKSMCECSDVYPNIEKKHGYTPQTSFYLYATTDQVKQLMDFSKEEWSWSLYSNNCASWVEDAIQGLYPEIDLVTASPAVLGGDSPAMLARSLQHFREQVPQNSVMNPFGRPPRNSP